MRAAVYTRVSTSDQELRNQLRDLEQFCERCSYKITEVYTDTVSGSVTERNRPGLKKCFEDAAKRKFDILIFWSLDRLTREGAFKTILYLQELERYGIFYKSYTEPYLDNTGIFKEVIISLFAVMAKQERIRISERTKSGLERARSAGKKLGRPALDQDIFNKIVTLKASGLSNRKIAQKMGISHVSVGNYLNNS